MYDEGDSRTVGQEHLQEAINKIRRHYRSKGYFKVKVSAESDPPGATIWIIEGPRYRVGKVKVRNGGNVRADVQTEASLGRGEFFSLPKLRHDVEQLENRVQRRVKCVPTFTGDDNTIDLELNVETISTESACADVDKIIDSRKLRASTVRLKSSQLFELSSDD